MKTWSLLWNARAFCPFFTVVRVHTRTHTHTNKETHSTVTRKSLLANFLMVQIPRAMAAEFNTSKQQGLFFNKLFALRGSKEADRWCPYYIPDTVKNSLIQSFVYSFMYLFFTHSVSRCVQMRKAEGEPLSWSIRDLIPTCRHKSCP